jgi:polysaccharide biosynthesis/export protein
MPVTKPAEGTGWKVRIRESLPSAPRMAGFLLALTCSLAGYLPSGFAAVQPKSMRTGSEAHELRYSIAPDDMLDIHVVDVHEISGEYRVGPDGTVTLPLLAKPIVAEGLAPRELSAAIADRLRGAGLVTHPNVVVTVKSSRMHSVSIVGAVNKPQIYPLFGSTTVLDVLSQAEGLSKDAGNTLIITRGTVATEAPGQRGAIGGKDPPAPATLKVNLKRLLETGDPSLNLAVYPGDRVTVERAGIVYVVGAVNRPGGFAMETNRAEMTVLQALALGEGLKSTALGKKAMIIRRGPQFPMRREEIAVNLKRILAGHEADPGLKPDDILFVPESGSKIALQRGAEAAIQVATGVIIWRR